MTRNTFADGELLSAIGWNGMVNAHNREGVVSGCTPSKGTGDFDVDIASGTIFVGGSKASISSTTKSLTTPSNDADLDSGEARADTITAASGDTVNVAEGTAAAGTSGDPVIAPDIPADEALLAVVLVSGDANALSSGDIRDYRVIIDDPIPNTAINAFQNFSQGDQFSGYPITVGTDTAFPFGYLANLILSTTIGTNSSVEFLDDAVEVRNPGDGSGRESTRIYNTNVGYDPSEIRTVRIRLESVTVDDSSSGIIDVTLTDSTDTQGKSGTGDHLLARIRGDGQVTAETQDDGTASNSSDSSQNNAFVNSLEYVELSYDGSSLTVTASDGTNSPSASVSTNYPSGTNLNLEIEAFDFNNGAATNVDFDVTDLEVRP